MSERQAKMFREELEAAGNARKNELEAAQREIVLLAKALAAVGQLSLAPAETEAPPAV